MSHVGMADMVIEGIIDDLSQVTYVTISGLYVPK